MTRVIKTVLEWNAFRNSQELIGKTVGLAPTMGALHEGHKSLIKKSREENDLTVVSIFVNPTQFNDPDDLKKYPKTYEQDLDILNDLKIDALFYPDYTELYPDDFKYKVIETSFSKQLCGASRPGHFDGVLTVVMKLLNIIKPDKAYFGEKDYQQYALIERMSKTFFMSTEIVMCPTVRDSDGLALSSRNLLLSPAEREKANLFPKILRSTGSKEDRIRNLEQAGITVDYIEEIDNRRFGAVYLGNVRLIDNVELN